MNKEGPSCRGGAIGVARMSNFPQSASHADKERCIGDIRIRFSVSSACSTKSSQSESGQLGSTVANVAMKWSFHVPIALSALLVLCVAAGVSSNLIGVVANQPLVTAAHSLSIRIKLGEAP